MAATEAKYEVGPVPARWAPLLEIVGGTEQYAPIEFG